jgi:type VI protein secretion system component VasF
VARRVRELLRAHDQGAAGRLGRPRRRPAWVVAGVALAVAIVIASLLPGVHAALESLVQLLS